MINQSQDKVTPNDEPMLPVGTQVEYDGVLGFVKFVDPMGECMTICTKVFPDEPVRNVCRVIYKNQFDDVKLVIGNNTHIRFIMN